jgi:2-C-methyl-D-erythritol 4-phosphate cytidylyltransferase
VDISAIMPLPTPVADNDMAVFAPLAAEAVLIRVARVMLDAVADAGHAVVAAADSLVDRVRADLASAGLSSVVVISAGAGSRAECVAAALQHLERGTVPSHVLLHDISRPLVSAVVQHRVIAALGDGHAVVMPAVAVTDSVKAVDAAGSVTATIDRSSLRTMQYPRGFAADQLSVLLAQRRSDEFDEVQEALRAGLSITVVDGDYDGFSADLPRDIQLVEALIASRPPDPHGR